jgi:membrane protease YdiL (CAAX protease family)
MTSDLPPVPAAGGNSDSPRHPWSHRVFFGPDGLRVWTRLLIALSLFGLLLSLFFAAAFTIPAVRAILPSGKTAVVTPGLLLVTEGLQALAAVLSVLAMTLIEGRSFSDYGMPLRAVFGKRFWQGMPFGFAMLTLLIALIALAHGFSPGGWALGGRDAVRYALLYIAVFILVAIFEELSFRGYLQATLGSGIGFWPAAVILSVVFGALHLRNSGEALFGALTVGAFGLLCAFSLRRTGSIWFAIGLHVSWDWGETYFYSVPDSGVVASGHLLRSSFHGPDWLTGGTVGPEASVLTLLVLALSAAAIHFAFPTRRPSS